jgi:hypothetical protein
MVLALGLILGSCSGFSGVVADNWPHWAGGLPAGAPPRPGAPGYEEFIAHKQQDDSAAKPDSASGNANPQPVAAGNIAPAQPAAVKGSLY